jgi:hypothetical protein
VLAALGAGVGMAAAGVLWLRSGALRPAQAARPPGW